MVVKRPSASKSCPAFRRLHRPTIRPGDLHIALPRVPLLPPPHHLPAIHTPPFSQKLPDLLRIHPLGLLQQIHILCLLDITGRDCILTSIGGSDTGFARPVLVFPCRGVAGEAGRGVVGNYESFGAAACEREGDCFGGGLRRFDEAGGAGGFVIRSRVGFGVEVGVGMGWLGIVVKDLFDQGAATGCVHLVVGVLVALVSVVFCGGVLSCRWQVGKS
jgi:hypothetical protein